MADKKISDLTSLTSVAVGDLIEIVDISDTSTASTGTNKKITANSLFNGTFTSSPEFEGLTLNPSSGDALNINNNTGLNAIDINQNVDVVTLSIEAEAITNGVIKVRNDSTHTGTESDSLLHIWSNISSSTGTVASFENDGDGICLEVNQNGNDGTALQIDNDNNDGNWLYVIPGDNDTSTSASAGSQTLPSNPLGFLVVNLNGTTVKIPYYSN